MRVRLRPELDLIRELEAAGDVLGVTRFGTNVVCVRGEVNTTGDRLRGGDRRRLEGLAWTERLAALERGQPSEPCR